MQNVKNEVDGGVGLSEERNSGESGSEPTAPAHQTDIHRGRSGFSWQRAPIQNGGMTVSDELLRQRGRFDLMPSGLPEYPPSDEEWQQRAERMRTMIERWSQEEPSEELADWAKVRDELRKHPVRFGETSLDE